MTQIVRDSQYAYRTNDQLEIDALIQDFEERHCTLDLEIYTEGYRASGDYVVVVEQASTGRQIGWIGGHLDLH